MKHEERSTKIDIVKMKTFLHKQFKRHFQSSNQLYSEYSLKVNLILSPSLGTNPPTSGVTCLSPDIHSGPNPGPNQLTGVMGIQGLWLLGGTPLGPMLWMVTAFSNSWVCAVNSVLGNSVIIDLRVVERRISNLETDISLSYDFINVVSSLITTHWINVDTLIIIGEIISILFYIVLNDRNGAGAYDSSLSNSGRLFCALVARLKIEREPHTARISELNTAVLLMITHAINVNTSGVKTKMTKFKCRPSHLCIEMTIFNTRFTWRYLFNSSE